MYGDLITTELIISRIVNLTKPIFLIFRVFPSDFNKERSSLRRTAEPEDEENDRPPYRPPPPPEKEDVPEKVLTLQERMSKFQQKVTTSVPPPKVCRVDDHFITRS